MAEKTVAMADERRKIKTTEGRSTNYKRTSANNQREARKDRNDYLLGICKEMDARSNTKNTAEMLRTIKEITGNVTSRTGSLKDENGEILTEIRNKWKKCTEKLYLRDATISDDFRENDLRTKHE